MNACPDFDAIAAFLDGEDVKQAPDIGRHLQSCARCAGIADDIRAIDDAFRDSQPPIAAPASLIDWIDARRAETRHARPRRRLFSRRSALIGAGAAASIAGGSALLFRSSAAPSFAATLFRDFATQIAADSAIDFPAAELEPVIAWLEPRLPFAPPRPLALVEIGVRGARLCWLLERRVAALHFGSGDAALCLYAAEATDLTLDGVTAPPGPHRAAAILHDGGASGAFWRDDFLAYGLIGPAPAEAIGRLARQLRTRDAA